MISRETLDEIEMRLAKGWVIRRDQIEALVAMCRSHPAVVGQPASNAVTVADNLNVNHTAANPYAWNGTAGRSYRP